MVGPRAQLTHESTHVANEAEEAALWGVCAALAERRGRGQSEGGAGAPEGPVLARLLSFALSVPVPWQASPTDEKGQGPSQTFGPRLAAPPPKAELVCVLG